MQYIMHMHILLARVCIHIMYGYVLQILVFCMHTTLLVCICILCSIYKYKYYSSTTRMLLASMDTMVCTHVVNRACMYLYYELVLQYELVIRASSIITTYCTCEVSILYYYLSMDTNTYAQYERILVQSISNKCIGVCILLILRMHSIDTSQ